MYRQILISTAVLGLIAAPAFAEPTWNPGGGWTCNASSDDDACDSIVEYKALACTGGMSSEPGGGETCSPGPAAAPLKLKHQLAKPVLRRHGR
jgi:hypothetical protein